MEEHIVRLREELDREREERNYFQLERDKIHTFWEITGRQLEEVKAELNKAEKDIEEDEERHQVEIKVRLICDKLPHQGVTCHIIFDIRICIKVEAFHTHFAVQIIIFFVIHYLFTLCFLVRVHFGRHRLFNLSCAWILFVYLLFVHLFTYMVCSCVFMHWHKSSVESLSFLICYNFAPL